MRRSSKTSKVRVLPASLQATSTRKVSAGKLVPLASSMRMLSAQRPLPLALNNRAGAASPVAGAKWVGWGSSWRAARALAGITRTT